MSMIRVVVRVRQADGSEIEVPCQDLQSDPILADNVVLLGLGIEVMTGVPGFEVSKWSVPRSVVMSYTVGKQVSMLKEVEPPATLEEEAHDSGKKPRLEVVDGQP